MRMMRPVWALLFALLIGNALADERLAPETQAVLDELRRLPSDGRFIVSFTHPWVEDGSGGESLICRRAGKIPRMYYTDFMFFVGSWHQPEYYKRCRERMTKVIVEAFAKHGAVPVFSWHCENPYAPKGLKNAEGRDIAPYRYKWDMPGYPAEHRYVMREFVTVGSEMEHWYEKRLDEMASFLRGLRTVDGRLVPCIIRPFHECDIDWWWGPKSTTVKDYVAVWRKTVSYLRSHVNGGANLLFCFSPDRYWKVIGEVGEKGYLCRYPGDDVVDIFGFDDYSIGMRDNTEERLEETIRKMRLVSSEAAKRGKVFGLTETGRKGRRDDFYQLLVRALSADGVQASFVDTWGGEYTYPDGADATADALKDFRDYVSHPKAVFASDYAPLNICASRQVVMMSLNVRLGCGLSVNPYPFEIPEGELGHLPECADMIRRVNPDWVAIQEIDHCTKRTGHVDQTAVLANLCGMKGTFVKKVDRVGGAYGLAILSKEQPLSVQKILVPGSWHTRCVEIVEFRDYIVACTHFPLKEEFRIRAAEIVRLNLTDRGKPVFIAGDFNASPESQEIAEMKKDFTILSDTTKPTFRADSPSKCIDYIMVDSAHSDHVRVSSYETIADPVATDHCGIVLKVELLK